MKRPLHATHCPAPYLVGGIVLMILAALPGVARAERIKDIVSIQGMRGNPLAGTGLVVGLAGDGDSGALSQQMLTNILRESGLVLPATAMTGGNIAAVIVTAKLGPFDREGARIDVNVSAIGDAKSLQGGVLLPTQLRGLDGQTYAIAEGGISLGGWTVSGNQGEAAKNHPTVGRIPSGATVELAEIASFWEVRAGARYVTLDLRNDDFTTATRIGEAINRVFPESCVVLDAGTAQIKIPDHIEQSQIAQFVDAITAPTVTVDSVAMVVINERTGTIVVGENVSISSTAIAQGSLVVKINETETVSQPGAPFSDAGQTVVSPETSIDVMEEGGRLIPVPRSVTVSELAKALNAVGATPRDLIAIFNALKEAKALHAELIIM
jgi:flagellar P-ring protein precursor FlgI